MYISFVNMNGWKSSWLWIIYIFLNKHWIEVRFQLYCIVELWKKKNVNTIFFVIATLGAAVALSFTAWWCKIIINKSTVRIFECLF